MNTFENPSVSSAPRYSGVDALYLEFIEQVNSKMTFPIILLHSLNNFAVKNSENTMQGFLQSLRENIDFFFESIKKHPSYKNRSVLTLQAVTQLYIHLITKIIKNLPSMEDIQGSILEIGKTLITNFTNARAKVARLAMQIFKTEDVW